MAAESERARTGGGLSSSFCDSNPFNQRFISIRRHLIVYITTPPHTHQTNGNPTSTGLLYCLLERKAGTKVTESEANGRLQVRDVDKCA